MSFTQVKKKCREAAYSKRDQGTRFEVLMQRYLQTDPVYKNQYEKIWLCMLDDLRKFSFREIKNANCIRHAESVLLHIENGQ